MRHYCLHQPHGNGRHRLTSRRLVTQAAPDWKKLEDYTLALFVQAGFRSVKPRELAAGCVTQQYAMELPSGESLRVDVAAMTEDGTLILLECKCQNRGGGATRAEIIALGQKLPYLKALSWVVCQGEILHEKMLDQCRFYSPARAGFQGITRVENLNFSILLKTGLKLKDI